MKKWLNVTMAALFAGVGVCTLALAGCGENKNGGSDDPVIFNGGIVCDVGDDIIFANGFKSDEIQTMSTYKDYASSTHLSSVKKSALVNDTFTSPNDVKNIKNEVTGFGNMYTFAYGDHVYYAAPNKHKTSSNAYVFSYVSFFRAGFDGSDEKELFTTNSYDSAKAVVRALKFQKYGYLIVFDGTNLTIENLDTLTKKVVENVTSVAIPRESESWNGKIYYTQNKTNSQTSGNDAFAYEVESGKSKSLENSVGWTATFVGRSEDDVFYTLTNIDNSVTKTYVCSAGEFDKHTFNTCGKVFYSAAIDDVYSVGNNGMDKYEGYVFSSSLSGNEQILYMQNSADEAQVILKNGDYSNILFTYGDLVYYSTTNGISYFSLSNQQATNVVENMTINGEKIGYDFYKDGSLKNIYFYAQRVYAEDDETAEDERDTNYYLYTKYADGQGQARLMGKTVK